MTLKLAKKAGRDFMIFEKDLMLAQQYEKNIRIANTIRDAIAKDKIIPYFQPIFDTYTLKVEKYEALVRLVKEDTVLTPYHFLDISQKIKLYPQITEIMIEKTFSMFELNEEDFSINLAFSDITNHKTYDMIFEKIVEHNIAKQLTIEILENQMIEDDRIMFDFINRVYSLGAKIAIDDFGSGFANFEYMTKIRSDYMKIDGSLIKNIDTDKNARLVVETIVVFAKKLGKKTIAEFVHSKEVYNVVKEIGIDYVQGFYFAEPSATLTI
jgi:EAL domain-containing protein (putative c-di-GMP-specific phosphodiesterase class I)